jgi:hypothetical protein
MGGGPTAVLSPVISSQPSPAQRIPTTRSWILAALDEVSWSGAYALWFAVAGSSSLVVVAPMQKRPVIVRFPSELEGRKGGESWIGGVHGGRPQPYNHQDLMATKMMFIPSNQRRTR